MPLTVTFSDQSSGAVDSHVWDYGDGSTSLTTGGTSSATSTLTHTHIYTQGGVYTVTLSVSDGVVTDTLTRTNYISVTQPLVADFSAEPLSGTVPLTVTFTNLSTPTQVITSAMWAYGDGVISNTLALTHTHIYTRAGVYTVTLSVSDGVVTDTLTRSNYITATGGTVYTTTTRVITYTYDKLYRLTGAEYSTGEEFSYAYDPVGNRTVQTRTLTATTVITYAYDAANRLVNVDGVDYTWDANGNLLSDGVRTFTYDAANRLTSVTSGTVTTTFEYDGLGNRTAQTVGGVTTEYVLDVGGGLPEVIVATTGGASTRYVQVQGQILAQHEAGAWGYVAPDALGSVRQVIDAAGQVTLAQSYDPFGVLNSQHGTPNPQLPFGYTGEWWDAEAGVLYLRARYYDPVVGRFVSKDLWQGDSSRPQSLNAWNYVQGNPLNFTDPSGRIFCPYGVDPETGTCNPPRWGGLVEGLPPTFAQTAVGNPASATVQVALSVLAYLYFRLADNLQPGPPPLRVGSPWEGLREWLPLGQQPSSLIPGPALGDTPEWLPAVLPGPYVDTPGTTPWLLDFPLIQPCLGDNVLTSDRSVARKIARGHAYDKHVIERREFPEISSLDEFERLIDGVMNNYDAAKSLSKGRRAYWKDDIVVITNPADPDGGTAFRPVNGKAYYDNLR